MKRNKKHPGFRDGREEEANCGDLRDYYDTGKVNKTTTLISWSQKRDTSVKLKTISGSF